MSDLFSPCYLCPRECGADRTNKEGSNQKTRFGACHSTETVRAARASLHHWEEPCISGQNGSGAVFFSGCNLGCVYCQNAVISRISTGTPVSPDALCRVFFSLKEQGAHNINLVTPTHFLPSVLVAVEKAKISGIDLPFVYNCGGYEKVDMLKRADGLIDIYLPDFKYISSVLSARYSTAPDYADVAKSALQEMVRQRPVCNFDKQGIMISGVLVRHMMLPGGLKDSKAVLAYLASNYKEQIYMSIMCQYTPPESLPSHMPELSRRVRKKEYDALIDYAISLDITQAFVQEPESASTCYIPEFDGRGTDV